MSVLTMGALCTALTSCGDDDNNNTTTNPTENYSSYSSWSDFTANQTGEYASQSTLDKEDFTYEVDDKVLAESIDNLAFYFINPMDGKLYSDWIIDKNGASLSYNCALDGTPVNIGTFLVEGSLQNLYTGIMTHGMIPQKFNLKIVAYDKETNTFYEGTYKNWTSEMGNDFSSIKLIKK